MVAVFNWGKKDRRPERLTGPRPKSYSAASGFVYEYAFVGQKEHRGEIEFLFSVTYDRVTQHRISVWVSDKELEPWMREQQRDLRPNERYAIAKMALRNAFDERARPEDIHRRIAPSSDEVIRILEELGV